MNLTTIEPQDQRASATLARRDRVIALVVGFVAVLPFVQLCASGSANQVDLGVATILLLLVISSLFERRTSSGRSASSSNRESS